MLTKVVGWKDVTYKIKHSYSVFICLCRQHISIPKRINSVVFSFQKHMAKDISLRWWAPDGVQGTWAARLVSA